MIFCAAMVAGVGAVYADEVVGKDNSMSNLITSIAQKFNLNEADVRAVFDQHREQMEARREQNREQMETKRQEQFESRLSEAVAQGKLTQAQANAIAAKRAELQAQMKTLRQSRQAEMDNMKNMTQEERKAAMEEQKTKIKAQISALKQWAADNGIPEEYLPMAGMGFMSGGHGCGGGFGARE